MSRRVPAAHTTEAHARINALLAAPPTTPSPPDAPLPARSRAEVRAAMLSGEQRYEAALNNQYAVARGAANYVEYRQSSRRSAARDYVVWVDGSQHELRDAFVRVHRANGNDDALARFTLVAELAGYAPSLFWSCVTYAAAKTSDRPIAAFIQTLDDLVFDLLVAPRPPPPRPPPPAAAEPAAQPAASMSPLTVPWRSPFALPTPLYVTRAFAALDAALLLNDDDEGVAAAAGGGDNK